MFYRTRHMVALKGFTYFDDDIAAGANFYATPVDGGYFVKIGRAKDAPEPEVAPLQVYQPAQQAPTEPIEPPAPQSESVEEVAEPEQAQEPEAAEPMPEPVPTSAPRRGRPPRQRA